MSGINEVRERLEKDVAGPLTTYTVVCAREDLRTLLADHARLQEATTRVWAVAKPATPGAYWVRGFAMGDREEMALVEVREVAGMLCSNLHERNSGDDDAFDTLEAHSDDFEWFGPLTPAVQP